MASSVEICNTALIRLGANQIASLNDGSRESKLCLARYDKARRAVLRLHLWKSAKVRKVLAPLTTTPVFGYDYQYDLPSDLLRLWLVSTSPDYIFTDEQYEIEGRRLLHDQSALYVI
ncbi:MAG: hypothetical protein ACXABY_17265 [Candidatus Thorarchaeota archaeon]|jgi:hypothetical protein